MFAFRRTRKFVRTVLLLALGLYLLAHLLIRSEWVGGRVLRTISERTGYEAAASRVRLTAALALSFTDFSLSYREEGATNVVFSAPHLRFGWCCGRSAEAVRAQVFVHRTAGGTTVPSQFRPPAGAAVAPDDLPRAVSPQFGSLHFRLTDSTLTVFGEGEDVVYDGLDWLREPVRLEGHSGAVQNVLTVQAVRPVQAEGGSFAPHELRDEWFELEGRSVRFDTRSDTGAETTDESHAENAESAETSGGANSPSEPPAAVESHAENAESAETAAPDETEPAEGVQVFHPEDLEPWPFSGIGPDDLLRFPRKESMQDEWAIRIVLRHPEGTKFEPEASEDWAPLFLGVVRPLDKALECSLTDSFGDCEMDACLLPEQPPAVAAAVAVPRGVAMADALRVVRETVAKATLPDGVTVEDVSLREIPPDCRRNDQSLSVILSPDIPSPAPPAE